MKFNDKFFKKKWVSYTIATCSAVVLFILLAHIADIWKGVVSFFAFMKPVITGIIIAYVFNPLSNFYENKLFKNIKKEKLKWTLSVVLALITILAVIVLLFVAMIPQLGESIATLMGNMDGYLDALEAFLVNAANGGANLTIFGFSLDSSTLINLGASAVGKIEKYFSENMGNLASTTSNIGKGILDVVLGLILAIYFLLDKKRIITNCARLMQLLMSNERYAGVTTYLDRCNSIIIKYISVDLIDGIIVGVVNYIFMLIMGMPYAALISVVVGVTNMIPTFGPIIGAVIGGFILVLINPWHALWFLVFTVAIQTVDGYILKPKLFGDSLGVSALMILIFIILGGRLFGVIGILVAIPAAAIVDFTWRDFVIKRLEERHSKRYNS
ncbi:AI-2E family transporter [Butyrivibrio sp. AE2032]|uniref:AI-2E family transporter n=1 Tax=Butyrivibrio sp. AE2032 TaxID=1458463 RepID=UPI0005547B27|nr:AI-2E family transporter [Butyrivibrio sp. AE2032]